MNQTYNALTELHRELGRVFDNRYGSAREPAAYETSNWAPQVDITETPENFRVLVDLPGVKPGEVEVTLHNDVLTIKGARDHEKEVEQENYKRRERIRGSFFRQFSLPESTDSDAIKAKTTNGVLEITIPKSAKPVPLTITVAGE